MKNVYSAQSSMPVLSEKVLHRANLKEKGYTDISGIDAENTLHVTQDLFDLLKANRANKEGVDHNNTHYAPDQVEQIIELFTLDPEDEIQAGHGDFIQWQDKLIDIKTQITQIVTKKEISIEDAKIVVETSHALNTYFNNFISPVESNPKYFRYIQTHVAYHHLYMEAIFIKVLIDAYIQESEKLTDTMSFTTRQAEVGSLETFVTQFQQLQDATQVTAEILTEYDTYLGWIQKYFPSVLGQVDMIGKQYFNGLNTIQHKELTNRVTAAYDDLQIAYTRLYPSTAE